jgi:hypothetical protein
MLTLGGLAENISGLIMTTSSISTLTATHQIRLRLSNSSTFQICTNPVIKQLLTNLLNLLK